MATMNGTIKRLVSDKGFGFVLAEDGTEYFLPSVGLRRQPLRRFTRRAGAHVPEGARAQGTARREHQAGLKPCMIHPSNDQAAETGQHCFVLPASSTEAENGQQVGQPPPRPWHCGASAVKCGMRAAGGSQAATASPRR